MWKEGTSVRSSHLKSSILAKPHITEVLSGQALHHRRSNSCLTGKPQPELLPVEKRRAGRGWAPPTRWSWIQQLWFPLSCGNNSLFTHKKSNTEAKRLLLENEDIPSSMLTQQMTVLQEASTTAFQPTEWLEPWLRSLYRDQYFSGLGTLFRESLSLCLLQGQPWWLDPCMESTTAQAHTPGHSTHSSSPPQLFPRGVTISGNMDTWATWIKSEQWHHVTITDDRVATNRFNS